MSAEAPVMARDNRWVDVYVGAARYIGCGLVAGLISGALVGGVGGRLAMFLLRLTSSPSLKGVETDDGFIIGSFTSDTAFLVAAMTALGAASGLFYAAVRTWLPDGHGRMWLTALLAGSTGGAVFLRPGGPDFTLIEPLWLAVLLFVALPAAHGMAVSVVAERLVRADNHSRWWLIALLPVSVLTIGMFGPAGVLITAAIWALIAVNRSGSVENVWRSAPVRIVGLVVLALLVVVAGVDLVRDAVEIL